MKNAASKFTLRNLSVLIALSITALGTELQAVESKYSLQSALTTQTNLYNADEADFAASMDLEIRPQIMLDKSTALSFSLDWERELTDEQKSHINDGFVGLSRKLGPVGGEGSPVSSGISLRMYLPMNEEAQSDTSFITRLYLSPSFSFDLKGLPISGLSMKYVPFVSRDFYQYETARTGGSNTKYTLGNILSLGYAPHDRVSFDLLFLYSRSWTFEGSRKNDKFRVGEEASYSFPGYLDLTVGHVNEGSALDADGIHSSVKPFNENASSVYLTLSKAF